MWEVEFGGTGRGDLREILGYLDTFEDTFDGGWETGEEWVRAVCIFGCSYAKLRRECKGFED